MKWKINPITCQVDLIGKTAIPAEIIVSELKTETIITDGESRFWNMPYTTAVIDVYLNGQLLTAVIDYNISRNMAFLQTKIQLTENQETPTPGEILTIKYVELEAQE